METETIRWELPQLLTSKPTKLTNTHHFFLSFSYSGEGSYQGLQGQSDWETEVHRGGLTEEVSVL